MPSSLTFSRLRRWNLGIGLVQLVTGCTILGITDYGSSGAAGQAGRGCGPRAAPLASTPRRAARLQSSACGIIIVSRVRVAGCGYTLNVCWPYRSGPCSSTASLLHSPARRQAPLVHFLHSILGPQGQCCWVLHVSTRTRPLPGGSLHPTARPPACPPPPARQAGVCPPGRPLPACRV